MKQEIAVRCLSRKNSLPIALEPREMWFGEPILPREMCVKWVILPREM